MVVNADSIELTRDEIVDRLEEGARRHGMGAAEMLRAYDAGELEDPSAVADLLALASLLTDEDELFEGRRHS
jgi:hypothetical protein